jgi:hypothetical protein
MSGYRKPESPEIVDANTSLNTLNSEIQHGEESRINGLHHVAGEELLTPTDFGTQQFQRSE